MIPGQRESFPCPSSICQALGTNSYWPDMIHVPTSIVVTMVIGMIVTSGLYTSCCGQLQVPLRTQRLGKGQTGRIRVLLNSGRKSGVSSGRNMQQRTTECLLELRWRNKKCETFLSMVSSVQFSSVTQSCLTLCDPMDCSTPGLPVHHQLPKIAQSHVHRVNDALQPSHSLSSPSPAFNLLG